jgi:hypothetical protein
MSIDATTYLMFGVKLPYSIIEEYKVYDNDDKYLPYIEGHKDIKYALIIDGMSGEYVVFGKVLNKLDSNVDDFYIMNEEIVKEKNNDFDFEDYEKIFNILFPNIKLPKYKASLLMFNHFS